MKSSIHQPAIDISTSEASRQRTTRSTRPPPSIRSLYPVQSVQQQKKWCTVYNTIKKKIIKNKKNEQKPDEEEDDWNACNQRWLHPLPEWIRPTDTDGLIIG